MGDIEGSDSEEDAALTEPLKEAVKKDPSFKLPRLSK